MQRWSLVCDNDVYFKTISQSLFFVGHFFGALIAGLIADWFGRKRAFILTLFPAIGFSLASHFVSNPYGWMALRFFLGVSSMSATTIKSVYTVSHETSKNKMPTTHSFENNLQTFSSDIYLFC